MGVVIKVGICRKYNDGDYGSYGAEMSVEGIEIPHGCDPVEVTRIRDHWLGLCEATVADELGRVRDLGLRDGIASGNGHAAPTSRPTEYRSVPAPERSAPAPAISARGSRREELVEEDVEEERIPTCGKQLLGWAGQQSPDAMPLIKQWCAARKIKSKIVDLSVQQVKQCYQHIKGTQNQR